MCEWHSTQDLYVVGHISLLDFMDARRVLGSSLDYCQKIYQGFIMPVVGRGDRVSRKQVWKQQNY